MFSQLEIYDRAFQKKGAKMPKKQPSENLLDLILLTEENRKQYVKLGHSFWTIAVHHSKPYYDVVGVFPVLPCLTAGFWYYKGYPLMNEIMVVYASKDTNKDDWERGYKEVIDFGIEEGNMYFDETCLKTEWKFSTQRLTK